MSETKVNQVADETPSVAEKEEKVLENAGVGTKLDDGTYKIDLDKINQSEQQPVEEVVKENVEQQVEQAEEKTVEEKKAINKI